MSLLTVNNISKHEEGRTILQDISFIQNHFQHIAIAGATGSGKTSLLRIVAGLLQPNEGEVLFENIGFDNAILCSLDHFQINCYEVFFLFLLRSLHNACERAKSGLCLYAPEL